MAESELPESEPTPQTLPVSGLKNKAFDFEVVSESPRADSPADADEAEEDEFELEEPQVVRKRPSVKSSISGLSLNGTHGAHRLYKPPTWMRRLLTSKLFLVGNAFIILLNMLWTGLYANSLVQHHRNPTVTTYFDAYFVIESVFSGLFLAELIVRLIHFASPRLWHDLWLCFDIVVIVIPAAELWILRPLGWSTGTTSVAIVNVFRIFRVGRGVVLMASINWFRPMYLAAVGFKHSISSLLLVGIYLATLLFTASLVLCSLLGPTNPNHAGFPEIVRGRFRSVGLSFLTLSECLMGGLQWGPELVDVLLFGHKEMVLAGIILFGFLVAGSLLWMNAVAGVFMQQVDRSFEMTNLQQFKDPEFVEGAKHILRDFIGDLKDLDEDQIGLSWRQIFLVVTHHMELLSDLGIRMPEAKRIFSELDMNNSGYVSTNMFFARLIENLKYKTLETLIFENQQWRLQVLMKKLGRLNLRSSKKVMDQLKIMSSSIARVESEEPLQSAVQRRLARQKQRVTSERDEFNESLAAHEALSSKQKEISTTSFEGVSQGKEDGHHLVIECWKKSVEEQRRNIQLLVNPVVERM